MLSKDMITPKGRAGSRRKRRFAFFGQSGTASVEFVIWMPIFAVILACSADACMMYLVQADMWDVARDTVRSMTTGELTATTAPAYATGELLYPAKPYVITATAGTSDVVEITLPIQNASVFGTLALLGGFTGATIDAKVAMRAEK
ncbi:MAG TPA: TadE family protein [Rhizomicrobium sp.]|nr:TadE family protein [Rhizomicrobium sp.]